MKLSCWRSSTAALGSSYMPDMAMTRRGNSAFSRRQHGQVDECGSLARDDPAGCSTAICGALGPYQAYLDVDGKEHEGTDRGEVFSAPPPPPAAYQTGRFNPTGLGEQLLRRDMQGAVAYIGCNTGGQPCGLTLVAGFVKSLAAQPDIVLGDAWASAVSHYYEQERLASLVPTDSWYPASIFFQGMKYMLFGDPTLPLRHSPEQVRPHRTRRIALLPQCHRYGRIPTGRATTRCDRPSDNRQRGRADHSPRRHSTPSRPPRTQSQGSSARDAE